MVGSVQNEEAISVDQQMQVLWHGRRIEADRRVGYRDATAIRHPLHGRERLIA